MNFLISINLHWHCFHFSSCVAGDVNAQHSTDDAIKFHFVHRNSCDSVPNGARIRARMVIKIPFLLLNSIWTKWFYFFFFSFFSVLFSFCETRWNAMQCCCWIFHLFNKLIRRQMIRNRKVRIQLLWSEWYYCAGGHNHDAFRNRVGKLKRVSTFKCRLTFWQSMECHIAWYWRTKNHFVWTREQ